MPLASEFHHTPSDEEANETYFAYFDANEAAGTGTAALAQLDTYLAAEGPFDALLGFSAGATLIATWLAMRHSEPQGSKKYCSIRCAVLFSAIGVYDAESLARGHVRLVQSAGDEEEDRGSGDHKPLIGVPTAHIWGREDSLAAEAAGVTALCEADGREVYIHRGGHEIPGVKDRQGVKAVVKIIRRTIARAGCELEESC